MVRLLVSLSSIWLLSFASSVSLSLAVPSSLIPAKASQVLSPHTQTQTHANFKTAAAQKASKSSPSSSLLESEDRGTFNSFENHDHVILFILDGFGSYQLERGRETEYDLPNLDSLAVQGAKTYRARCNMPILSQPNIASILTGAPPMSHGIVGNCDYKAFQRMEPQSGDKEFPTIAHILQQNEPTAEIIAASWWTCFHDILSSDVLAAKIVAPNNETDYRATSMVETAMDGYYVSGNDQLKIPKLAVFHFEDADLAGHRSYWGSPQYWAAAVEMDKGIGKIMDLYRRAGVLENTLIVVTADHGGGPDNEHGGDADIGDDYDSRVPIILRGPDVKQGYNIPCPDYGASECYSPSGRAIFNQDVSATIAFWLGIDPPRIWRSTPIYSAFDLSG